MPTYTPIFGGSPLNPSQVSYIALTLTANTTLAWPLEGAPAATPLASTIDVTSTVSSYSLTLPDATGGGNGYGILINNLSGSTQGVPVKDNTGGLLLTVSVGEQWMLYLADNSTAAGVWRVFRFGASTATVNPSTLAGYGVVNTSGTLSQAHAVTSLSSSPYTVVAADRAGTLVWTGSGNATFNLTAAATLGNNFFFLLRNAGGGDVTLDPNASETIDGSATISLQPGESAILVTDGTKWFSVGLGRQAVFAFDFTSISLASAPATYTLSGAELNRVAYKFTGLLTNNVQVIVPATIQQYWVDNRTTGAFSVTVKTASGTGVVVNQNTRGIYYCDGTDVVNADTAATALPINPPDGGTGITSYTTGDMLYASSSSTMAKLAAVATGKALISAGVGVPPTWGLIDLGTMVTGGLPVANGGTGLSAALTTNALVKQGATTFTASIAFDDGSNFGIGTPTPSQKLDVTGSSSPYIRLNTSSGTNKRVGFQFSAGGTAQFEQGVDLNTANVRNWYLWDSVAAEARLAVDSSGLVGVGTSSPGAKLDVATASGNNIVVSRSSASGYAAFQRAAPTGQQCYDFYTVNGAEAARITADAANFLAFSIGSSASERARIGSSGVGIGTTSLDRSLSVYGTDCWIRTSNASRSWLLGPSNSTAFNIYDETAGVTRVAIDTVGKVSLFGAVDAGPSISTGNGISTGDVAIELGGLRTGSGNSYLDFHSTSGTDYEARAIRDSGANGGFSIINTGTGAMNVQQVGAADIVFNTNSTERTRIKSDGTLYQLGNLGVGVSSPSARLHVRQDQAGTTSALIHNRNVTGAVAALQFVTGAIDLSDNRYSMVSSEGSSQTYLAFHTSNGAAPTEKVRIDYAGKLGIGTTTPGSYLHVKSPDGYIRTETSSTTSKRAAIAFSQNGTQNWDVGVDLGGTNTNDFYLYDNLAGAARLTISAGGAIALRGQVYFDTAATQNIGADSTTMYLRATNFSFQNATATSTQMYLANDKLGIGTTGPSYRLDVVSGDTTSGYAARLRAPATGAGQVVLQFTDTGATVEWGHIRAGSGGLIISNATTFGIDIGGSSKLSLSSTGAVTSADVADAVGYKGLPQNSRTSSYTLALSDMGKHISITTGGIVIPANGSVAFPVGATVVIYNDSASTQTISITTDTLRQSGTTNTGSRTLAAYGLATLVKVASTTWVVSGSVT